MKLKILATLVVACLLAVNIHLAKASSIDDMARYYTQSRSCWGFAWFHAPASEMVLWAGVGAQSVYVYSTNKCYPL